MPKIIQYREECIGCNSCVEYARQNWKIDEDGKSTLLHSKKNGDTFVAEISEIEVEDNVMAARACPMNIIRVLDDSGKEIQ